MSTQDEIWKAIVEANRSWKGGNPTGVAALFDENVVLGFSNSPRRLVGREAMVRHYVELCQELEVIEFRELDHSVDVIEDTAVAHYRFRLTYEANGVPHQETGREVLVFRRRSEGAWLVVWRSQFPDGERSFEGAAS
jgi:ketosteroid isomerase-like protein